MKKKLQQAEISGIKPERRRATVRAEVGWLSADFRGGGALPTCGATRRPYDFAVLDANGYPWPRRVL